MSLADDTRRLRWSHRPSPVSRPSSIVAKSSTTLESPLFQEDSSLKAAELLHAQRGCYPELDVASPVDTQAELLSIPTTAMVKGMFFTDVVEQVRAFSPQAIDSLPHAKIRYSTFGDYPQRDYHELIVCAANLLHPRLPAVEAVRQLAWNTFPRFARSVVGRVVMGVLGNDIERLLEASGKAWSLVSNRGSVEAVRIGERHWHYEVRDVEGILDGFLLGIPEGLFKHLKLNPNMTMRRINAGDRDGCIRW